MPIDKRNKSDMYSILDKLRQSKQLEFDSEREKKPYYYDDADKWDEYPLPKAKPSDNDNYEEKPLNEGVGPIKNLLQMFDGSAEWLAALNKQLRSKINKKELQDILKKSEYKKVDDDIAKNPEAYIGNRVKKDNINEDEIDEGYAGAINFLRKLGGFGDDVVKVIPDIKPIRGIDAYGNKIKPIEVSGNVAIPKGNSLGIGKPMSGKNHSPYQIMADPNLPKVSTTVIGVGPPKGTSVSELLDIPKRLTNNMTFAEYVAASKIKKSRQQIAIGDYDKKFGITDANKLFGVDSVPKTKVDAISNAIEANLRRNIGLPEVTPPKNVSKLKQRRIDAKAKKNKK
jgi:hypothetical protein